MDQNFIQQMVNFKIKQLTATELIQLAKQYDISISKQEAEKVILILRNEKLNISNEVQIRRILAKIKKEVSPKAMYQAEQLLNHFLSAYSFK